jgi:asparagine synthase (glutamine-hydrolysing)
MLAAVVHARGVDAARDLLGRAIEAVGRPSEVVSSFEAAIAGWRTGAPMTLDATLALEGITEPAGTGHLLSAFPGNIEKTRGDFAAIVPTRGGLVLGSGPGGGHRPIFAIEGKEWCAASTHLHVLLRLLASKPPLDMDYVASSTLADYPLDRTATPYRTIRQVPLGEAWRLRPGMATERRPILRDPPAEELRGDERELAGLLRDAIFRAVSGAAKGATRLGVMLSGGLDSSSVVLTLDALAKTGRLSAPFEAYSWEFDTPDENDDRPYRRAVERRLGRPAHRISPAAAGAFVRRAMVLDAAPCVDTPCPLWFALFEAARAQGVDRIVTGLGGDNVLDGHPRLFGELARRGQWARALAGAIGLKGLDSTSPWVKVRAFVLRPLARAWMPSALQLRRRGYMRRRMFRWMGPAFTRWTEQHAAVTANLPTLEWSPRERYEALARMPFLADMARIRSQHEAASALRRTEPLFDDDLLRFVATLPPLSLLSGGFLRGLMRAAMAGVLPDEVRLRPWKAYMDPGLVEMVGSAGGFGALADLTRVSRLADLGLVEPKRFSAAFDALARQPLHVSWWSVWPALIVEEFLRQYDEGVLS